MHLMQRLQLAGGKMLNKLFLLAVLAFGLLTLYACANTSSFVRVHPEVEGVPSCSECHDNSFSAFNHRNPDFKSTHRFFAGSSRQACASCHQESFCTDCHTHKDEIKPSEKFANQPERNLPHRGDYRNQHKIDGRVNPASCVKCHGRQNNARCVTCHK